MLYRKILFFILILANLLFVFVIYSNYQSQKDFDKLSEIRTKDFISKSQIKDYLIKIKKENLNKEVVLGIISPTAKNCFIESVLTELKQEANQGKTSVALLPSKFTLQETKNFKQNFNLDFEVRMMGEEISKEWVERFKENKIDGVVVVINEDKIKIF